MEAARRDQIARVGREIGPIHWIGSPNLGPWTWLGFFWERERFWFGYAFTGDAWRLLLEADDSRPESKSWDLLKRQLPEVWNYRREGRYLRLWAEADLPATDQAHRAWLRSRSQELDEFVLSA